MLFKNKIKDLTSSVEELDYLKGFDAIYISYAPEADSNEHTQAMSYIPSCGIKWKLRGDEEGPATLANAKNDHNWYRGYLFGVHQNEIEHFEKELTVAGLMHGVVFEKITNNDKEIFNSHVDSIFEVIE